MESASSCHSLFTFVPETRDGFGLRFSSTVVVPGTLKKLMLSLRTARGLDLQTLPAQDSLSVLQSAERRFLISEKAAAAYDVTNTQQCEITLQYGRINAALTESLVLTYNMVYATKRRNYYVRKCSLQRL